MRVGCHIFFSLLVLCSAFAQQPGSFEEIRDSSKVKLYLSSHFEANANTLPNTMLRKVLWGGFMSSDFLTETRGRLRPQGNRFGNEFHNKLFASIKCGKTDLLIGVKYRELLSLRFSQDLFGLAFLGNAAYEGKEADLSTTQFHYWQYSSLELGIGKMLSPTTLLRTTLGLVYGSNYQELRMGDASFYTAPDGAYLRTKADMKLSYKGPSNGIGLTLNAYLQKEWNNNLFFFAVEDIGMVQWQNLTVFEGHTSAEFKGTYIPSLSNFTGDSLFADYTVKGLGKKFGISEKQETKTVLLPFSATIRFAKMLAPKWKGSVECYYTYLPAYFPRVTARAIRLLPKDLNVNLGLSYGGFGRENLVWGLGKKFNRNWSLQVEGYFIGIFVLPKISHGTGFNLALKKGF